jgi:hypothetical protein
MCIAEMDSLALPMTAFVGVVSWDKVVRSGSSETKADEETSGR